MEKTNNYSNADVLEASTELNIKLSPAEANYFLKQIDPEHNENLTYLLLELPHFQEIKTMTVTNAKAIIDEAIYNYKFTHPNVSYTSFNEAASILVDYCSNELSNDVFSKMKIRFAIELLNESQK